MEKEYKIANILLVILSFIVFNILFINEDASWKGLIFFFAIVTAFISYPSSFVSMLILRRGDTIRSDLVRSIYYIVILPIIVAILSVIMYFIISGIFGVILGNSLSGSLVTLVLIIIGIMCVIIPYVQTILILIIKYFMNE